MFISRMKLQRNASRTFFSNQAMKQTFCLFHFFPDLLLVEKKNENALKDVLISSNCTKHIQAGDIKVFCGLPSIKFHVLMQKTFRELFTLFHRTGKQLLDIRSAKMK